LYVPEIQEVYSLGDEVAQLLRAAEVDPIRVAEGEPMSAASRAAYEFASMLIGEHQGKALSETRSRHEGLRDVVVHVSQICNLKCVYCYAVELNRANKIMSLDTADQVIARTMELAPDGLASVKFLGGEPTLAWHIIEHLMEGYAAASVAAGTKPPRYTMVTNGTRMTPAMVNSAARQRMHVLVSIVGR
jgi:uncharacterized protein